MTDSHWERLIQRAIKARKKADDLIVKAEAEYERRYGSNPRDIDDDWWIDTIETAGGFSIQAIIDRALEAVARD